LVIRKHKKNKVFDDISRSHENLLFCYYCDSKIENYLNKCIYCEKKFCDTHRLSENHECLAHIVTDVKAFLIDQYQKLDSIKEDHADSFEKRAEILATIKRPGVTIKLCEYIMENFPDSHIAVYLAASQHEKLLEYNQALNLYKKAVEMEPENKLYNRSYNLLGTKLVLEFKKRFRTAKKTFDTIEEKDEEIILKHLSYEDLALKIDELYTPPKLQKMISDMKKGISKNSLNISQQMELIKEKFDIEALPSNPNKYTVDLGNNYSVILDLSEYPKMPKFEFAYFVEEKLSAKVLPEMLHSLRTWSETQPYNLTDVISELKACLGFFRFGKLQISQQFIDLIKQTARDHAPNEMGGFIQLDRWVIWRLRLPQKYFSTPFATGFYKDQLPFMDSSVVGFIHSHTLGPADPSDQDRKTFQMYYINMILGSTEKESSLDQLVVFDRYGKVLEYEITTLLEEEDFLAEEKKSEFKRNIYV
jgi:proteasome lid subunit RPN8/RPN11